MSGEINNNIVMKEIWSELNNAGYTPSNIDNIDDSEMIDIFQKVHDKFDVGNGQKNPVDSLFDFLKNEYGIDITPLEDSFSHNKEPEVQIHEIVISNKGNVKQAQINNNMAINRNVQPYINKSQVNNIQMGKTFGNTGIINGEIDESVMQGQQAQDCWLITGVLSLDATTKGKEAIKNSIQQNNDGSVTINFKGAGVSYNISPNEILGNNNSSHASGDLDMRALEIATEKLRKDIAAGKINLNTNNEHIDSSNGSIDGGYTSQMIYLLTGVQPQEYNADRLDAGTIQNVLGSALNDGNTALGFSLRSDGNQDKTFTAKLTNGEIFSTTIEPNSGHAYSITNVTKDTVTFVDPYNSAKPLTMPISEFEKLGISRLVSAKL